MKQSVELSHAFRWLEQVQPSERLIVGDKAYYLSVLLQRNYPVVPGFVVTAPVLRHFLEQLEWLESMFSDLPNSSLHLNVDNARQLQGIARQIRRSIQTAPLPAEWTAYLMAQVQQWQAPALIVRPSLALDRQGDFDFGQRVRGLLSSYTCLTTEAAIAHTISTVWAELFHARSLFYWQRSHIPLQRLHLAVLIHPLWPTDVAGEMGVDDTAAHIRAIWGFGHGLVQGDVAPDRYSLGLDAAALPTVQVVPKLYTYRLRSPLPSPADATGPLEMVVSPHPLQPALNRDQINYLKTLGQRAKADLGAGLEVEWCYSAASSADPAFWITQIRLPSQRESGLPPEPIHLGESVRIALQTQKLQHWLGQAAAPGRVLKAVAVVQMLPDDLEQIQQQILVVQAINPEWLPLLQRCAGLITEQGGITSHGAILARELGIPAVVGVPNILKELQTGDVVLLDGDRGTISLLPTPDASLELSSPSTTFTAPPPATVTQLMVTLSQPDRLEAIAQLPISGLGLLRSEHVLVRLLEGHPLEPLLSQPDALVERLVQSIQPFVAAFAPRPVFYRSNDLRSHEYPSLAPQPSPPLQNPILGWHGPLGYHQNPALFQAELMALRKLQLQGYDNLRLLLPFVRTVEEFQGCFAWVREAGLCQPPEFQIWMMAEVPAVLFQLPEFVQAGVQGIAIGTNDLTQLLLAIDRDHPQLVTTYTAAHPAVLSALHHLISKARALGIPSMLCGAAPMQHPEIIPDLVRWGITGLSVSPDAVEAMGVAIAQAEQQLLLEAAREALR